MRKTNFSKTIETLSFSKKYTSILFFVFIFGISTGIFFEILMHTDIKSDMQYYLKALLHSPVDTSVESINGFIGSIIINILAIAFIILSGYTRFSYATSSIILFLKGLSLGYCCALILESLAFKGILIIILSLLPQNTLLVPTIFISANIAISKSFTNKYKKNKGITRSFNFFDKSYLYSAGFLFIIVIISCLIQSIFLPIAARLI